MKDITGYEGLYAVTEDGRIWSHPRVCIGGTKRQPIGGRFMRLHRISQNRVNYDYVYVDLYKNCKRKREYVHRLVAQAFIQNPNNCPEVNHKNYIKDDNRVENLEWISRLHNMHHGLVRRNTAVGERASNAKLKQEQVLEIRDHAEQGIPRYALMAHFNMSYSGIKSIINRDTWKHI